MRNTRLFQYKLMAIFSTIFLLTGCVKFDVDLVVNKDSTVSGTMIFAISDALNSLGQGNESENMDVTDELVDPNTKGVSVEEYDQGGFKGEKITLDNVPFSEFQKGGDSGDLTITREGNLITLNGFLDLSMEDTGNSEDEFSQAIASSLFASADLRIRISFPAPVVSTTGELSEDRRTVTWEPKIGDRLDLTTTVELPSPPIFLFAGIGILVFLVMLLILFGVKRQKNKKVSNSAEVTPIEIPTSDS